MLLGDYVSEYEDFPYVGRYGISDVQYGDRTIYCKFYCRPDGVVTAGVTPSGIASGVALWVTSDGDFTAGVASMVGCRECDVVLSGCICDYDDYIYDG